MNIINAFRRLFLENLINRKIRQKTETKRGNLRKVSFRHKTTVEICILDVETHNF